MFQHAEKSFEGQSGRRTGPSGPLQRDAGRTPGERVSSGAPSLLLETRVSRKLLSWCIRCERQDQIYTLYRGQSERRAQRSSAGSAGYTP